MDGVYVVYVRNAYKDEFLQASAHVRSCSNDHKVCNVCVMCYPCYP